MYRWVGSLGGKWEGGWGGVVSCRVSLAVIPRADRGVARYKADFHIYES